MALLRREGFIVFKAFEIPVSCWERTHNRTKEISCLQLLSWNPTANNVKYDLYCPILYEDVRNKRSRMYFQPILIKVCRSVPPFVHSHTKTFARRLVASYFLGLRQYQGWGKNWQDIALV